MFSAKNCQIKLYDDDIVNYVHLVMEKRIYY